MVIAKVAPAEKPPMASLVVPKRRGACWASQTAAVAQSSGAAGHGCSGAGGSTLTAAKLSASASARLRPSLPAAQPS